MCLFCSPRRILKNNGNYVVVYAPCGHCIECLKRRQNDWKLRISHECAQWKHCYFFTLTYREDTLPCNVIYDDVAYEVLFTGTEKECMSFMYKYNLSDGFSIVSTACKSHVQDFVKRIREDMSRKLGTRWPLKYFICAEYGPSPRGTKRPHYHGILLCNEDKNTIKPYFATWENDFGRIDFKEVGVKRQDRSSVANYISKYCCKGGFESRKEDIDNGLIERAWTIMSKNIGLQWLEQHKQDYLKFVPFTSSVGGDWTDEDFAAFAESRFYDNHEQYDKVICEIDDLIRNIRVFDGEVHGYKMPRYYYDRIINKPIYQDRIIRHSDKLTLKIDSYGINTPRVGEHFVFAYYPEAFTCKAEVRKVKRFSSESFLSAALRFRLRMLAAERDFRLTEKLKNDYGYSDSEVIRMSTRNKERAIKYREKDATSRLATFYETNMWKHREFDD